MKSFGIGVVRVGVLAALIVAGVAIVMLNQRPVEAQKVPASSSDTDESGARFRDGEMVIDAETIASGPAPAWVPFDQSNDGAVCEQETRTYSTHNFTNPGATIVQGGFVETEIFAASYTIDAINFPIRIDHVDGLFAPGQLPLCGQVTTEWTMLVWEGNPNTGNLVCIIDCTISSDGKITPHMVVSPPTQGIIVQAMVDPGDPDQIIVQNNATTPNTFSVGFRIDDHNVEPTASCQCLPGCGFCGTLPPICCPPTANCNLFPTTDATAPGQSPNFPTRNWLWARSCPGATCSTASGWYTSNQLGISGDWNLRVAFTPSDCVEPVGSCCLAGGTQCLDNQTASQCAGQGGTFQGTGTTCAGNPCTVQTGRCCLPNGSCAIISAVDCSAQNGTYLGNGGQCVTDICKGACCVPSTQQCVFTFQSNCAAANGVFQGIGTTCAGTCFGACCLPDGSCVQTTAAGNCTSQGGTYQGGGTSCGTTNCPQPVGGCCLGTNCLSDLTEEDCETGFGGTWLGAGSNCAGNPCDPTGACCLGTSCLSDLTQTDCVTGFGGSWEGAGTTCSPTNPCEADPCPADIAPPGGNGTVGTPDLLQLINAWGPCAGCEEDLNNSGTVGTPDLLILINAWGPC